MAFFCDYRGTGILCNQGISYLPMFHCIGLIQFRIFDFAFPINLVPQLDQFELEKNSLQVLRNKLRLRDGRSEKIRI